MIIGTIAGLALPAYGSAVARYRLQSAVHQLRQDMDRSVAYARATGNPVTIVFDTANHVVTFNGMPAGTVGGADLKLDLNDGPRGATIAAAAFGGNPFYTISGYGVPSSGGTVTLQKAGASGVLSVDRTTGLTSVNP